MWTHSTSALKTTSDGELWTTVTEREDDVWVQYFKTFTATTYAVIVSLGNTSFPHILQKQGTNRLDGTELYYSVDIPANANAIVRLGVITRIDGVNADIKYFANLPLFGASKATIVSPLRISPSQLKLDINNGSFLHGLTNESENNVAAVNTGVLLDSALGNITPGLGDVILKYEHTSGSANVAVLVFYHAH